MKGSNTLMMGRGVVLGGTITEVSGTRFPVNVELALLLPISHPTTLHVHGFGVILMTSGLDDAFGGGVVSLDLGGGLGMVHF